MISSANPMSVRSREVGKLPQPAPLGLAIEKPDSSNRVSGSIGAKATGEHATANNPSDTATTDTGFFTLVSLG
jgi:hypothetical protein